MSIRKIKNAVNNTTGELIYFKGHAKATFMSDGSTVEDAINNISISSDDIDLTDYYTKEEIDKKGYLTSIPSDYVTETEIAPVAISGSFNDLVDTPELVTGIKINDEIISSSDGLVNLGSIITPLDIKTVNGSTLIGSGDITVGNITAENTGGEVDDVETPTYAGMPISQITGSSLNLLPNIYYKKTDIVSSITVFLSPSLDSSSVNEYILEFSSSSTGTSLTLPNTIKWVNGEVPKIEPNSTYQISIVNNLGVCVRFY